MDTPTSIAESGSESEEDYMSEAFIASVSNVRPGFYLNFLHASAFWSVSFFFTVASKDFFLFNYNEEFQTFVGEPEECRILLFSFFFFFI